MADPALVRGYRALGVGRPWAHQVEAARLRMVRSAHRAGHVDRVGQSLAFWLPALSAVRADAAAGLLDPGRIESTSGRGSVLYLCPTKALAADQLAGLARLLEAAGTTDLRPATCDGDSDATERRWRRSTPTSS